MTAGGFVVRKAMRDGREVVALLPVDKEADEIVRAAQDGSRLYMEARVARNVRQHRLFFAVLKLCAENTPHEEFNTTEKLLEALKIETGHFETYCDFHGNWYRRSKSISFYEMDQVAFNAWMQKAFDVIRAYVIPGLTDKDQRGVIAEAEQMIGERRAA